MGIIDTCAKAKQEGHDAFDNGIADYRNPYPLLSDEHMSWNDGWNEACAEDEEDMG